MKLWRIDADFVNADGDVVGMLTYFSSCSHSRFFPDAVPGWNLDRYEQDATGLSRAQIGRLLGRTWPVLPIEDLLAIADGVMPIERAELDESIELSDAAAATFGIEPASEPLVDAKRQLRAALNRRGHSSARVAWEKE